ncbi:hypothetical protein K458DRAFT_385004 [Lentithecium fluviatile CBS 122367]|uniref:Uncharacterized protein n=1 Tax=Lentithecium fluviatile CBS 122367 TaxID=1168545 RepID=A0A6G1JEH1_9PLEO|nr:hypothetical protein K458DRAFT_385004 [Lentithecium fluviatile CBS 122367]
MPDGASICESEGEWEEGARRYGGSSQKKMKRGAAYVAWEAELGPGVSMRTMYGYGALCALASIAYRVLSWERKIELAKRICGGYDTGEEKKRAAGEGVLRALQEGRARVDMCRQAHTNTHTPLGFTVGRLL